MIINPPAGDTIINPEQLKNPGWITYFQVLPLCSALAMD